MPIRRFLRMVQASDRALIGSIAFDRNWAQTGTTSELEQLAPQELELKELPKQSQAPFISETILEDLPFET